MSSNSRSVESSQTQEGKPPASDNEVRRPKGGSDVQAAIHPTEAHAGAQPGEDPFAAPRTAGAAADMIRDLTRRAAEHGAEMVRFGVQAVAAAQVPLVAAEILPGRQIFDTSSKMMAVYSDAVHSTAEDAVAIVRSFYDVLYGIQKYRQDSLDAAARSYQAMSDKRRAIVDIKSPVALAEMQRDIYVESVSSMCSAWSDMLTFTAQIAQAGMRPLKDDVAAGRK